MPNPGFLILPRDWLSRQDVRSLTAEERGWFFDLVCHSWHGEGLPNDPDDCAALAGADPALFKSHWDRIATRLRRDSDGRLRWPPLEEERSKQSHLRELKQKGAAMTNAARWRSDSESHSDTHSESHSGRRNGRSGVASRAGASPAPTPAPVSEIPPKAPPERKPRKKRGEGRQPQPWRHLLADFKNLDVPGFCFAMDEYMAHRAERGADPYTGPGLRQRVRELSEWGVPRSLAAIRYTMGRNWIGIREEDQGSLFGNNGRPRPVERNNVPAPYDLSGMPEELRA